MGWRIGKKENFLSKPYFEDGDGQPNRPSWPKNKFLARNGRTCVTPQALASPEINVLLTRLNNYPMKNWLKTLKSAFQSQNWILGTQNL
jgi:hypothetical protein